MPQGKGAPPVQKIVQREGFSRDGLFPAFETVKDRRTIDHSREHK